MATTTPNFGWPVPTSTDLVKDGATAIESLGDSIDASLLDLKGGTSGQVLSKNSNTDMDFTWVTSDDANAIQNTIVDAKGDLISASAADTPARLAVGTNGQVLTADSTAATGLAWASPAVGSTFVGASARSDAAQSIANNTETTLNWELEDWDTDAFHDNSTNNSRLTIPSGKSGYYQINTFFAWANNATGSREIIINKNGATLYYTSPAAASGQAFGQASFIVSATAGDYFTITVYQSSGGALNAKSTNASSNRFQIAYLGA
jgi:hypothetical protein